MKAWLLLIVVLISNCLFLEGTSAAERPRAKDGLLDLSDWTFLTQGPVPLNGDWEFYWGRQLDSYDFNLNSDALVVDQMRVPDYWRNPKSGITLPEIGYATYRLNILVQDRSPLSLKFLSIGTAFRLIVDGEVLYQAGQPGTTRDATRPEYSPDTVTFVPKSNRIELIIQVSNFHHRSGGIWESILIGLPFQIQKIRENTIARDLLIFGAVLMMGLYNLATWFFNRENVSGLFLGVFCLLIGSRELMVGERFITQMFPSVGWEVLTRLEYFCWMLAIPTFLSFIRGLFPGDVNKISERILWGIGAASTILALLLPIHIVTEMVTPYQIVTVLGICYGSYCVGLGVWRKREGSLLLALGCAVLFYTAIADIIAATTTLDGSTKLQVGLFVFVLLQSVLVSVRYSRAFKTIERQASDLLSTNLELQIQEKLRLAAEGQTRMMHKQVIRSESIEALGLIARATVGTGTDARGVLGDLANLVAHKPLVREEVEVRDWLQGFQREAWYESIVATYPDVRFQFQFEELYSLKVNASMPHLQTFLASILRYSAMVQNRSANIRLKGGLTELDQQTFFNRPIEAGQYLVINLEDEALARRSVDADQDANEVEGGGIVLSPSRVQGGIRPEHVVEISDPEEVIHLQGGLCFLAAACAILEEHNGALDIFSHGEGTRIEFYFPLLSDPT